MSGKPRNNLQDVLQATERPGSQPSVATTPTQAARPTSKFKPASAASKAAAVPNSVPSRKPPPPPSNLPSFSTPNFGRKPPAPLRADISIASSTGAIDISSGSSDASPPLKRTSSDSFGAEPVPVNAKRVRKMPPIDKENILHRSAVRTPAPRTLDKGKGRAIPSARPLSPTKKKDMSDAAMTARITKLRRREADTNPFDDLERGLEDIPKDRVTLAFEKYPDLRKFSLDKLKALLLDNLAEERRIQAAEEDHYSGRAAHDTVRLNAFKGFLADRINALKVAVDDREASAPEQATWNDSMTTMANTSVETRISTSLTLREETFVHSSNTSIRPADELDGHEQPNLDSDDMLWNQVDPDESMLFEEIAMEEQTTTVSTQTTETAVATPQEDPRLRLTPFYAEIVEKLHRFFRLRTFRTNQLEAITSTMEGKDVFVLMPTGGGKSLCYQLPAICQGGSSSGVTIIVSPLLALMEDQVENLMQRGIEALQWTSEAKDSPSSDVNKRMYASNRPNLLYVTPEKMANSGQAKSLLSYLHRNGQLARFVIDEAHCISSWGHDFRNAYLALGQLRQTYPGVPIMALTATATPRAADDIIKNLHIERCIRLKQSFNRTNLHYSVVPKKKMNLIAKWIQENHAGESGIIYTLSKKGAETGAEQLRNEGIAAEHYHAGMTDDDRKVVYRNWKSNRTQVMVATIAFGMGIDKPDVRFVIHHTIPKSLDGYYQETGRAGRDGNPSDCVLHYAYKDANTLYKMIREPKDQAPLPPAVVARQEEALRAVILYCNDISQCRRVHILRFFGETFEQKTCKKMCDNCANPMPLEDQDMTAQARSFVSFIQAVTNARVDITQDMALAAMRGANTKPLLEKGLTGYSDFGACSASPKELIELLLARLLCDQILDEQNIQNGSGFSNAYLRLGKQARTFLSDKRAEMVISWRPKPGKGEKQPRKRKQAAPASRTNSKKRKDDPPPNAEKTRSLWEDEDDIDDDYPEDPQPPPTDEVIEIDDGEPPSPRRTRSKPRSAKSTKPDQIFDDDEVTIQDSDDIVQRIQAELKVHRAKLARKHNVPPDVILHQEMLDLIAAQRPQDYKTFQEIMLDGDCSQEGRRQVERDFEMYELSVLGDICIRLQTAHTQPPTRTPSRGTVPFNVSSFSYAEGQSSSRRR